MGREVAPTVWEPCGHRGLMEAGVLVQESGAGQGLGRDQHWGQGAGHPVRPQEVMGESHAPTAHPAQPSPALSSVLTLSGQGLGKNRDNWFS